MSFDRHCGFEVFWALTLRARVWGMGFRLLGFDVAGSSFGAFMFEVFGLNALSFRVLGLRYGALMLWV